MTRPHKRKLLIPNISDTNLDNTFVRASQVDSAMNYMFQPIQTIGNLNMAKINQKLFAQIKMPKLPAHLRTAENIKPKSRLVRVLEMFKSFKR